MNRVIKFRAWDGESMEAPNPRHELVDYIEGMICRCGEDNLMQFTGLQDKNGVEIYEGDIVVNEVVEEIYTVKFGAYGYTDTVGFHCVGHPDDPHSFYGGMGDVSYLTVIGNIHENPQFLESSK